MSDGTTNETLVGAGRGPLIVQLLLLAVSVPVLLVLGVSENVAFVFGAVVTIGCCLEAERRIAAKGRADRS